MASTTQGADSAPITPNEGQQKALDRIGAWAGDDEGSELAFSGAAGTGKTTCLRLVKDLLPTTTLWAAMTGKAASRMKEAAGIEATTLHRILYEAPTGGKADKKGRVDLSFGALREPEGEAVVIDEASMITPSIYRDLQLWRKEFGTRVLYVGDSFQLPPVLSKEEETELRKKGASTDYSVFSLAEVVSLTKVMRNGDAILDAATELRTKGTLPTKARPGFALRRIANPIGEAIDRYLADPIDHMLITWMNKTRMNANLAIRHKLGISVPELQPGEPVLVCKNQFGGAVLNGEVYEIASLAEGETIAGVVPTIKITTTCGKLITAPSHNFDGSMPYIEDFSEWKRYRRELNDRRMGEPTPVTYGHVLSIHKCQGSQSRRVTVFLPKGDTASPHFKTPTTLPGGSTAPFGHRAIYTAITRAKQECELLMGL